MKTDKDDSENLDNKPNENENVEPISEPPVESESGANVDAIGDTLLNSMPEVQQHAIDQEQSNQAEFNEAYSDLVDKNGNKFDPKIHKTKKGGIPSISKTGKLMLKPNSGADLNTKATTNTSQANSVPSSENSKEIVAPLSDQEIQQCAAMGKISAGVLFGIGRALGGDEWQPAQGGGYNEAEAIEEAFKNYYVSTGTTEISPKTALGLAIVSYAAPRFSKPITQKKVSSLKVRLFAWWNNRKGAKEQKARDNAERVRKDSEKKESTFEA